MTKIPISVLTWDSLAAPIPTFELVPGTLISKLRTHKTRQSGAMSIRQWSSFLERNRRLFWHQRATNLMYEIEEDDSEFLSWSSSISSNMSMNSDSDDDELVDQFHVAFHNANAIACDLAQPISHENIDWRWKCGLSIDELSSDDDALTFFRFRKVHLQEVSDKLWPRLSIYFIGTKDAISFGNGHYSAPFETLLLLVMFRLSRPPRIRREMEEYFRFRRTKICAGIRAMVDALYSLAVQYLSDPTLFHHRMPRYAEIISAKCGLRANIWGFIDGTLRRTCRPTYHQKLMYSGHKRTHGMKFQVVVTPGGIFACMFGAIWCGNRHDSYMLTESGLLQTLRNLMPTGNAQGGDDDGIYSLYGDPAYPQSAHVFGGFQNPLPDSPEALWNTLISSVRESVEWGFAYINRHWAFLNFFSALKLF